MNDTDEKLGELEEALDRALQTEERLEREIILLKTKLTKALEALWPFAEEAKNVDDYRNENNLWESGSAEHLHAGDLRLAADTYKELKSFIRVAARS